MKTVIVEGVGSTLQYKSEPQLVECADGSILCVYRCGSGHINNDGRLMACRSVDKGDSWGEPWLVYDAPIGHDTRNPGVGIDPATGRIAVFGRTYDATTSTQSDVFCLTSDDHGDTFGEPVSLTSALTGTLCPFGRVVATSSGLAMTFYAVNKCSILFSTDGLQTWGGEVIAYNYSQSAQFNEPMLCAVDENRVALVCRDDGVRTRYAAHTSDNGCQSWVYRGVSSFTTASVSLAAPVWAVPIPGTDEVAVAYAVRNTLNRLYYVRMSADAFMEDPGLAWIYGSAYPSEPKRVLATALRRYGSVTTAADRDFGYPCILPLADRVLVAWYDSGDGTGSNCTIYCTTAPAN